MSITYYGIYESITLWDYQKRLLIIKKVRYFEVAFSVLLSSGGPRNFSK